MFDTLRCEFPLPIAEPWATRLRDAEFQTKDLECALREYTLRRDGSLWYQQRRDGDPDLVEPGAQVDFEWVRHDVVGTVDFYGGPPVSVEETARRALAHERGPYITFRATFDLRGLQSLRLVSARLT